MSNIKENLIGCIGNTPLCYLRRFSEEQGLAAPLIAKLELLNPLGSVKDRVGVRLIQAALEQGQITKSTTVIEPTSGNTGIGLAMACTVYGLNLILTMPDTMSKERRDLLSALGAQIVLTPGAQGMQGAIDRAQQLRAELGDAFIPQQFENPENPQAHRLSTGPEILRDMNGKIDAFVAGVGTGGTITGIGEILKAADPSTKIIAVEPKNSAVLSGGKPGSHGLQGIGAGFVPKVLNTSILDEIIPVTDEEAFACCRLLAKTEGILCGVSGGAALHAACEAARRSFGQNIVVLLPDTGSRYLSMNLFCE